MDEALIARIDAYAEKLKTERRGTTVARGDAIRVAIIMGLDAAGIPETSTAESKKGVKKTAKKP